MVSLRVIEIGKVLAIATQPRQSSVQGPIFFPPSHQPPTKITIADSILDLVYTEDYVFQKRFSYEITLNRAIIT